MMGTPATCLGSDSGALNDNDGPNHARRRGRLQKMPPLSSPPARQYLLASSTAALAAAGLACAVASGWSCQFATVSYNTDWDWEGDGYEDLPTSVGVFCASDDADNASNPESDSLRTVSKAFLSTALALGALLLVPTIGISTIVPSSSKLWDGISYLAALTFVCQMPVFLILDSQPCNLPGAQCSLGRGSIPTFVSLGAYLTLALMVQWNDCPDWKEEYEVWQLIQRSHEKKKGTPGSMERGATEGMDEEQGYGNGGYVDGEEPNSDVPDRQINATKMATTMPKHVTQSKIEKMGLLSHDDLIPSTNDTPLVLQSIPPEEDTTKRKEKKQSLAQFLREERMIRAHLVPGEVALRKERSRPPVSYVSIHEDDSRRSNSPIIEQAEGKQPTTPNEGAAPITPDRRPKTDGVSPITHGSGGQSTKTEDYARELEGRGTGNTTKSTPDRPPTEVVAVSPMTACTGLRMIPSKDAGDAGDDNCEDEGSRRRTNATAVENPTPNQSNNGQQLHHEDSIRRDANDLSTPSKSFDNEAFGDNVFRNDSFVDNDAKGGYVRVIADISEQTSLTDVLVLSDGQQETQQQDTQQQLSQSPSREPTEQYVTSGHVDVPSSPSSTSTNLTSNRSKEGRKRAAYRHVDKASAAGSEASNRSNASSSSKKRLKGASSIFRRKSGQDVHVVEDNDGEDGRSAASGQLNGIMSSLSWPSKVRRKRVNAADKQQSKPADNEAAPRIVSPEKDHDPDIVFYQSDSSLSTLSLPTDDYHSSDDDHYPRHQTSTLTTPIVTLPVNGDSSSDISASDDSELSQIIAGVNKKLNRKTSGKITPMTKRRRRKKGSRSASGYSSHGSSGYSSHAGSLLDEIIVEEGELNSSNEADSVPLLNKKVTPVPVMIDASPSPRKRRLTKSRGGSKSGDGYVSLDDQMPDDVYDSGYESGYASPPKDRTSDAEESFSSRAARARRNRILSKRRERHPELDAASTPYSKLESPEFPNDEPATKSRFGSGGSVDRGMNNRSPPRAKIDSDEEGGSGTAAWRARKVRMARIQRMHGAPAASAVPAIGAVEDANEPHGRGLEPEDDVIRAQTGIIDYSSDEDSI